MRLYEIVMPLSPEERAEIDRICAPHMPADVRAAIEDDWRRAPPVELNQNEMSAMYGGDQEKKQLELRKLHAEVMKIEAEAALDRAEAAAAYRSSRRS